MVKFPTFPQQEFAVAKKRRFPYTHLTMKNDGPARWQLRENRRREHGRIETIRFSARHLSCEFHATSE